MTKITINCSVNGQTFQTVRTVERRPADYEVADEAYVIALMFAETQMLKKYGCVISDWEYGKFLSTLDFSYTIEEVRDDGSL